MGGWNLSNTGNASRKAMNNWDGWVVQLPIALLEPQELDILGSVNALACLKFNYTGKNITAVNIMASLSVYRNESKWCNYTTPNISRSSNAPLALPAGVFLTCSDQAWQGVPSHIAGGLCTMGV